ncbi:NAD(P)/FAD-dependent oxidoreductase [Pseudomonas sp. GD03842]|uniref:NAD(P)/FAD-dependent oxidoreductase n=1 Tax=unclassified Pseudomonas TaxID=196821 RepID=UPI000D34F12E|nr:MULTISPECIES: FAD/NAD(P)-binding oxidoreductase [unclassified Pseudomonas]MDH0746835.1 NAD(P)/FAD-dependent oxidoreductase [Pseudomonas sp. GD03842]RAU45712.1 FAD-dependent oxidoreductase [Pseudomonas sp. RIT 409]RAU56190.1 FAD-dependent oxidoreductase [Pseudomonas sp. RIT 412]
MNHRTVDVIVIGAGPAGMSGSVALAKAGLQVLLLDEQTSPGGQIYRGISLAPLARRDLLGPDYARGNELAQALAASSVQYETGASVWQVTREHEVSYLRDGRLHTVKGKAVLLATGAMERPFPIPGWTLPGVMTAGAAQILLKSAGLAPNEPVVLAGCGPLLYLLGWQYLRAGVPIKAIIDTTRREDYWHARRHLFAALRAWPYLRKGLELMRSLHAAGIAHHTGATQLAVEGEEAACAVTFTVSGTALRIPTRCVLLHQGVVPNIQFSQSLRARHDWNAAQLCFTPVADEWGELDVPGVYVAGDGAGIGGAQVAALQGEWVALGIANRLGILGKQARDEKAAPLRSRLEANLRIRPFLDALYRPKDENRIPADNVVVCRCEELTAGEIRQFVALGCTGPNQAKSFGRCGMGPCQGRLCGLTVTEVIAKARGVSAFEVGYYRIRPPIKPITLGELAGE